MSAANEFSFVIRNFYCIALYYFSFKVIRRPAYKAQRTHMFRPTICYT